jgi:hypothetical protein
MPAASPPVASVAPTTFDAGFNVVRIWAFNDWYTANEDEEKRGREDGRLQMKPGARRVQIQVFETQSGLKAYPAEGARPWTLGGQGLQAESVIQLAVSPHCCRHCSKHMFAHCVLISGPTLIVLLVCIS